MTKREAKNIALAILSLEDLGAVVGEQCDVLGLKHADAKKVVKAAQEIEQEMYSQAGKEAVEKVAGPW